MSQSGTEMRLRQLTIAFRFVFWPFAVLFLLFGIPVVGNVVVIQIAEALGCAGSGGGPQKCMAFGFDIGGIYYGYAASLLVLGAWNPLLFIDALHKILGGKILTVWIASILVLFLAIRGLKGDIRQQA